MRVGVVIPTIAGREEELRRALHSVTTALPVDRFASGPVRVIAHVENDHPTCGEAWNAGVDWFVAHYPDEPPNWFLLYADDLIADERWLDAALRRVDAGRGELPAPQLFLEDGSRDPRTDDGPDGVSCYFSRVPFVPWALVEAVFPMPPLHYYSDAWIADRAHELGYSYRVTAGFAFTHLWASAGRYGDDRHGVDRELYERDAHANPYRHLSSRR